MATTPSWWQRNWKWLLAGGLLAGMLLFAGAMFAVVAFVFGLMRQSTPYQHGLDSARDNPAVVAALGRPIEPGFFVTGNISLENDSGSADISVALHGSRNDGRLYIEATRERRHWSYQTLVVQVAPNQREIDLLD